MGDNETEKILGKVDKALKMVAISLPHLSGLAYQVLPVVEPRCSTVGVFASGKMIINPQWFGSLELSEAAFVMAHELMHLALQTHIRSEGCEPDLFNIAHDYIINDTLEDALGQTPPAGGLRRAGARHESAESIVAELLQQKSQGETVPKNSWQKATERSSSGNGIASTNPMAKALQAAGLVDREAENPLDTSETDIDVLPNSLEKKLFPDLDSQQIRQRQQQIEQAAKEVISLGVLENKLDQCLAEGTLKEIGTELANNTILRRAFDTIYRPPWELALQQWIEAVAPGTRSYARASRRGANYRDFVLPGRKREGWILNIILDTSGSMAEEFERIFGAIAFFGESSNVTQVRLLQCDTEVTSDEIVTPDELREFKVSGLGGSDLSAAMLQLADEPEIEAAIVITDGYINYPQEPMPYETLWVLTEDNLDFYPEYGQAIVLDEC